MIQQNARGSRPWAHRPFTPPASASSASITVEQAQRVGRRARRRAHARSARPGRRPTPRWRACRRRVRVRSSPTSARDERLARRPDQHRHVDAADQLAERASSSRLCARSCRTRDGIGAQGGGVPTASLCADPGLGFGKTGAHNVELLARLAELVDAPRRAGARRTVAQVVHRVVCSVTTSPTRATTARSPPRCGPSIRARASCACTTRGAASDALGLLAVMDATRRGGRGVKGRWAQGLEPRAFCWIIKDGWRRRSDRADSRGTTARCAARRS